MTSQAESLTAANLRTELNSLQGEYKLQAKLLEKELRHVKLLSKENETLKNLLQKGPEGQKYRVIVVFALDYPLLHAELSSLRTKLLRRRCSARMRRLSC
jgi:hypothetical protein